MVKKKPATDQMVKLSDVQKYIDDNSIYQVEFEHYEDLYKWVPLKTKRIDLKEVFGGRILKAEG